MEKPGIVITGASGRMGQMLVRTVLASDQARLVGAIERPGNPWIGRDLGEAMGGAPLGITVTDDAVGAIAGALRGRLVNALITNEYTADHLLKR